VYSDHRIAEARILAVHCRIARNITRDPGLLEVARRNPARWRESYGADPPGYLVEWEQILARPWPVVADILTALTEDAARLLQFSPFAGILSPAERSSIYEALRA
jgi:hypothetical protein